MSHLLIRIALITAAALFGGIVGYIGVSSAHEARGIWMAIPTALLLLIITGLLIVLFWTMPG